MAIAEEWARYSEKERRYACHSFLKDFLTTLTETQGGSGGTLHNIFEREKPLRFGDNRDPPELDVWAGDVPMWAQDEQTGNQDATGDGGVAPPEGTHSTPPTDTNIQPKRMPRPQQSGGASSSGYAAFRAGPGTSSTSTEHEKGEDWIPNVDWMKKKKPSSVEVVIYAAEDYTRAEQRVAFLKAERTYVLSTIEGHHSTREFETNLQWKQYMRRMTFHAALTYNICTEGQLDSQMLNANEFEWLKLYHYMSTTTELVRCKGYPVTEVWAMLTLGVGDTVPGDIRNNLKKLGNQIGQFIIKRPWSVQWDELGGQVRNNTSLILTDLTYQTRSNSHIVHDIETGLNNMGIAFLKVYQLPYESLEKPEDFLKLADEAATFLRTNPDNLANMTVHVWITCASLLRGPNRIPNIGTDGWLCHEID